MTVKLQNIPLSRAETISALEVLVDCLSAYLPDSEDSYAIASLHCAIDYLSEDLD